MRHLKCTRTQSIATMIKMEKDYRHQAITASFPLVSGQDRKSLAGAGTDVVSKMSHLH